MAKQKVTKSIEKKEYSNYFNTYKNVADNLLLILHASIVLPYFVPNVAWLAIMLILYSIINIFGFIVAKIINNEMTKMVEALIRLDRIKTKYKPT